MKELPYDLQKDINSLPDAENRLSKKMLTIAVYALSGVVGVLFAMVISAKNLSNTEKDKQLAERDRKIERLEEKLHEKDSLYTNCLVSRAHKENEDVKDRKNRMDEKALTLRIQDSILKAMNSR